jgi:tetratricopeptide (TPR) repeat protein
VKAIKIILILALSLGGIIGCQSTGKMTKTVPINPRPALDAVASDGAAAYYYFVSSQMKLKEGDIAEAQWMLEKAIQSDPSSVMLRLEAAGLHLIRKNPEAALQLILQVLNDHPNHGEALILAGRTYQHMDAVTESKFFFERALAGSPSDPNIYVYLGRLYWNENDLYNAERVFRMMAQQFPDSYVAHYFIGKILVAQGNTAHAEAAFIRSLELEPSLEESRFELIRIYRAQKRSALIGGMYQSILEYQPENIEAAVELAVIFRQSGNTELAAPLLLELGQRSETEGGILSYLFDNFLEDKKYELSVWLVLGMLKGAPQSAELNYMAGVAFDGLKMIPLALDHLKRVPQDSRFYKNAVVYSALMLRDSGQIDQSIQSIRNALQTDPQQVDYYLYLGTFYEELEQYDKAIDILSRGIAVDNSNIRLHFRVGIVHDKAGRKQDAIESMKQVLELHPQDAEALNYLGYTYAELGIHLDEAETLIQSALQMKPNDGYITDSLAWVYYKQGRYEEALDWLMKAQTLVPDDPIILEHLGDVHLKLNRQEKAIKYYKRSLEKSVNDREQLEQKIRTIQNNDSSQPNQ